MSGTTPEHVTGTESPFRSHDPAPFAESFRRLTKHEPFPWQRALYDELVRGRFPTPCDIPTGLGKTAVMAIWLLALAHHARAGSVRDFPRRLVYVVNRRTVVDQATREAERMRQALLGQPELRPLVETLRGLTALDWDCPLAISTLRGQHADNAEWRLDPARPALVIGTVDMLGSRLLFSGYGCGFKTRPLHAGFLGQDALLVHDEAHLEPAFEQLVESIAAAQQRQPEVRPFRVMAMTATARETTGALAITDRDLSDAVARARLTASKALRLHPVSDDKGVAGEIVRLALEHQHEGSAVLIYLRTLERLAQVEQKLRQDGQQVQLLTGTLRGLERDRLAAQDPLFARFLPHQTPPSSPVSGTVYLLSTSAGEVGVDLSADHLVCDLTPFDSMTQRLGRVNRFGAGQARIELVHPATLEEAAVEAEPDQPPRKGKAPTPYEEACRRCLSLLRALPPGAAGDGHDASPAALRTLPLADRLAAFSPAPEILPTSEILFDAWSLTTVRRPMPGRPAVEDWLHGVSDWDPPTTRVAWRMEVDLLGEELRTSCPPAELLADYPLKPHELLQGQTTHVFAELVLLAERHPEAPVWVVPPAGEVEVRSLARLVEPAPGSRNKPEAALNYCTVILPPSVGGLRNGLLDGRAAAKEAGASCDVADLWLTPDGHPRRVRSWDEEPVPAGMRPVRSLDTRPDEDEEDDDQAEGEVARPHRLRHWHVLPRSADDDGSRAASKKQSLEWHQRMAGEFVGRLVARLQLPEELATAVVQAAARHDRGKDRALWQRSIRNQEYPAQVLAKSGGKMRGAELNRYRHELGTLLDLAAAGELAELAPGTQDLIVHLIATHHGRARPHFPVEELFDPEHPEQQVHAAAREIPRRFARLQRRYGRWGLAYLESLVRAADALASQPGDGPGGEKPCP